jgi:hypothetical protein
MRSFQDTVCCGTDFATLERFRRAFENKVAQSIRNLGVSLVYHRCFLLAAVAITLALPSAVKADIVYTDEAAFLANVQPGYYKETFDSLSNPVPNPATFSLNGFSYDAAAAGGLYAVFPASDGALSTSNSDTSLILTFTSGNVTAVGGYFFPTDLLGQITPGIVTVALDNGTTQDVTTGALTSFLGFTTTVPITSLTISISANDLDPNNKWSTVNDLFVGTANSPTAAPEPATLVLASIGLLGLAGYRYTRKKKVLES